MKAYKIELIIVDHDEIGDREEIIGPIENANYPNDCINPHVLSFREADIGEWYDDHPLNGSENYEASVAKYFPE
jgi:hypothetical protein